MRLKCPPKHEKDYQIVEKHLGKETAYKVFQGNFDVKTGESELPYILTTDGTVKSQLFENLVAKYGEKKAVEMKLMIYSSDFKAHDYVDLDEHGEPTIDVVEKFQEEKAKEEKSEQEAKQIGLTGEHIGQLENLIMGDITLALNNNKKVDKEKIYDDFRSKIEALKSKSDNKVLDDILSNWDYIKGRVDAKIAQERGIRVINHDDDHDDLDQQSDSPYGKSFLEKDAMDKVGNRLKWFFSNISQYSSPGTKRNSFLGQGFVLNMPMEDVYRTVAFLTADKGAKFDDLMAVLDDYVYVLPWMRDVTENLKNAPLEVKKQFCKAMSNATISAVRTRVSDFNTTVKVDYVNTSATKTNILEGWQQAFKNSTLAQLNDNDDAVINAKRAKQWADEFKKIDHTVEAVGKWLAWGGLDFNPAMLKYIHDNGFTISKNRSWEEQFTSERGIFKALVNNVLKQSRDKESLEAKTPVYGGIFLRLAELQAMFTPQSVNGSYRDNGKNIFPINNNKFATRQLRKLLTDSSEFVNDVYARGSFWLNNIVDGGRLALNLEVSVPSQSPFGGINSEKGKEFSELTPAEHERLAVGRMYGTGGAFIDRSGGKNRIIMVNGMSVGKPIPLQFRTIAFPITFENGVVSYDTKVQLYKQLVRPDIRRMKSVKEAIDRGVDISKIQGYKNGWNMFYAVPSLNKVKELFSLGDKNNGVHPNIESEEYINKFIIPEIDKMLDGLVKQKLATWKETGIGEIYEKEEQETDEFALKYFDRDVVEELATKFGEGDLKTQLATDFVIQNLVANANIMMLFSGDPANYFDTNIEKTFDNVGKRLMGMVAPHSDQEYDNGEENVRIITLKDLKSESSVLADLKKIVGDRANNYAQSKSTDSQEYHTVLERLRFYKNEGLLPDGFFEKVRDIINEEIDKGNHNYDGQIRAKLNEADAKIYNDMIFATTKPVYYQSVWDEELKTHRTVYIKSSAIVLSPSLTNNLELDKLRVTMEKNGIDRAVYESAVKLGNTQPATIFDKDGSIGDIDVVNSLLTIPRDGGGIQQEIPIHREFEINRVGQVFQNLFINLGNVEGFMYKGKTWNGDKLKKEFHRLVGKLYEEQWAKLKAEIGYDGTKIDVKKLKKVLLSESVRGGYSQDEINALFDEAHYKFLPYDKLAYKHEQYLNSLVWNRVLKITMPGHSGTLASSSGIKGGGAIGQYKGQLVFTDRYNAEKGLQLKKMPTGAFKAQVILPWRFKDNITRYITNGLVDSKKLGDLLDGFGMRIPNNGHNSQVWFEVVGFSPQNSADLVFAPDELITRMGWDFDADKLYSYLYEHEIGEDGMLKKSDSTKNDIIDIHIAVHSNGNQKVQAQINTPLSSDSYVEEANRIAEAKGGEKMISPLSDEYQKWKASQNMSSKKLVGVYAQFGSLLGICQGHNLKVQYFHMNFCGQNLDGTLFEDESILDNASTNFQAVVDNEKLNVIHKVNDNMETVNATLAMYALGIRDAEAIKLFRSQPIIDRYLTGETLIEPTDIDVDDIANNITKQDLVDMLSGTKGLKDKQWAVLARFKKLTTIGGYITKMGIATGVYSKGMGKNFNEAIIKEYKVKKLLNLPIDNVGDILGNFDFNGKLTEPTTIPGHAVFNGLYANNEMWSAIYPYKTPVFEDIIKKHATFIGHELSPEERDDLFKAWKSYQFTKSDMGINSNDVTSEWQRLFIDTDDNYSLARKLQLLSKKLPNDPLLSRLTFNLRKNGQPSLFMYNATFDRDSDQIEIERQLEKWLDDSSLIPGSKSTTYAGLAEDIIRAQIISGGNQGTRNFIKFVPWTWFYSKGIVEKMSGLNYKDIDESVSDKFLEQFYQNYPELVKTRIFNPSKDDKVKSFERGVLEWNNKKEALDEESKVPQYIAVRNFDNEKVNRRTRGDLREMKLMKFTGEIRNGNAIYKFIPALGYGELTEFNANITTTMNSAIEVNNVVDNLWNDESISVMEKVESDMTFEGEKIESNDTEIAENKEAMTKEDEEWMLKNCK